MSESHRRKKQPERVRRQLVDVAARIASEQGVGAVTLDAVAQAAGVSKGGLLHHFPGKLPLLDGLFEHLVEEFDRALAEEMRQDPVAQGRFSRAYLRVVADLRDNPVESRQWAGLTMAMLNEPHLRERWRAWVEQRNTDYVGTDSSVAALIVRLAADGLWLADVTDCQTIDPEVRKALVERLVAMTLA